MSNYRASIEAPIVDLVDFGVGDFSPAFEWNRRNDGLQTGAGASVIAWASVKGSSDGTGEVFQVQTSPDGTNWATLTAAMAAVAGDQMVSKSNAGDGVGASRKPLKFIRIGYISTTSVAYTAGTLTWGVA